MNITGGQAVVRSLVAHGVEHFFGLPGVQSDWLYNAIYDEGQPFRVYTTRHEQGAAYMALGYSVSSSRVGVMSVVPGPGLLNAGAGLATAYGHCARMVALVGQIPSEHIDRGRGLLHEVVDQPSITRNISRWNERADDPSAVSSMVARAFAATRTGDPRPAVLELPPDVLGATGAVEIVDPIRPVQPIPDAALLQKAAHLIGNAQRPLIVVGGGALDSADSVRDLAHRIQAPVAAHRRGRGVLDARDPLAVSHALAHRLWSEADLVIVIGSRGQQILDWGADDDLDQIWINPDGDTAARMGGGGIVIPARAEETLPELVAMLRQAELRWPALAERALEVEAETEGLQPQMDYLHRIRAALGENGILVTDLTQLGYVTRRAYDVYSPRTFIHPGYPGTLGFGFAAALGVRVANPTVPVVAVVGDGGFLFTGSELATAVHYGIDTVTVVFDNAAFGNVKLMQQDFYEGRVHATDLTSPDFVALAEAFGASATRTDGRPESIDSALDWALATPGPTLVVVPQAQDWPSPWPHLSFPPVRGEKSRLV